MNRRHWLKTTLGLSAAVTVIMGPLRAMAVGRQGFDARDVDDALQGLLNGRSVEQSKDILLKIPDIAENGAVVPVSVSTELEGVQAISLLIENNPNPLTGRFELSPDVMADVSARIKMGESSVVRVYVETADKIYTTAKEVKVTIGGCGG